TGARCPHVAEVCGPVRRTGRAVSTADSGGTASPMKDEDLLSLPDEESYLSTISGSAEPRPEVKRGYRILYPLLALLVCVALAPLASLAWRFVSTNRETLATTQQEFQLLLASSIAGQLDSHIEGLRGRIGALASSLGALVQAEGLPALEKELTS